MLAQKVLRGETRGYRHHPQLIRFKAAADPKAAIAFYLEEICREAERRGYHFDRSKIIASPLGERLPITRGQLKYEFCLLLSRLISRDIEKYKELKEELEYLDTHDIEPHSMFYAIEGDVAEWEKHVTKKKSIAKRVSLN